MSACSGADCSPIAAPPELASVAPRLDAERSATSAATEGPASLGGTSVVDEGSSSLLSNVGTSVSFVDSKEDLLSVENMGSSSSCLSCWVWLYSKV